MAAKMADEGLELPYDMIETLALKWKEPFASAALVATSKNENAAKKALNFLNRKSAPPDKVVL